MQFSQQKLDKKGYFFSQPHQPFFTLGIINAILFMALFIPAYKGFFNIDARFFHSYSMIFLVFTNFFFGFLYTTFPRFSGTEPIEPRKYLLVFLFMLLATISFGVSLFFPPAFYAASLFVAAAFAATLREFYRIYRGCVLPKKDQYWLIVALGIGAMSNIFYLFYYIPCGCDKSAVYSVAVNMGVYLYLLFLGFVVAFRMVPFFSHVMAWEKNEKLHLEVFVLFFLHSLFASAFPKALFVVDLIAAFLITKELFAIRLPRSKEPLLWILHLAVYWLAFGLMAGAVIEFFEAWFGFYSFALPLHLLALGFLLTILIGFGTRVTLGHSGNMLRVDKSGVLIFYFTQIVVLGRMIFSLAASFGKITPAFDISATLWILLFVAWLYKYGAVLVFGRRV